MVAMPPCCEADKSGHYRCCRNDEDVMPSHGSEYDYSKIDHACLCADQVDILQGVDLDVRGAVADDLGGASGGDLGEILGRRYVRIADVVIRGRGIQAE